MSWLRSKRTRYDELQSILDELHIFNGTQVSPASERVVYDMESVQNNGSIGILLALKDRGFDFCIKIDSNDFIVHSVSNGLLPVLFSWSDVNVQSINCLIVNMSKLTREQLPSAQPWTKLMSSDFTPTPVLPVIEELKMYIAKSIMAIADQFNFSYETTIASLLILSAADCPSSSDREVFKNHLGQTLKAVFLSGIAADPSQTGRHVGILEKVFLEKKGEFWEEMRKIDHNVSTWHVRVAFRDVANSLIIAASKNR